MKKIIYTLLFLCATNLVISSCSEEEIKPNTETTESGSTQNDKTGF